jgi:DNA-binding NarL/FixJ family response regulator
VGIVIEGVPMTRILIADDHAVVRSGVRRIVEDHLQLIIDVEETGTLMWISARAEKLP